MATQANDFTNLTFRKENLQLDTTKEAYEDACNAIKTLTGTPTPEREEYTLEDTISTLTNTQAYEKEFHEALLAGDTQAARNAYQAATTAKALSQEFLDRDTHQQLTKTIRHKDAENDLAYITKNLEKARQAFNKAGKEFSELWHHFYKGEPFTPTYFENNQEFQDKTEHIRELTHLIEQGARLRGFVERYTSYRTPNEVASLIRNRATPMRYTTGFAKSLNPNSPIIYPDPYKPVIADFDNRAWRGTLPKIIRDFAQTGQSLTTAAKPGTKLTYHWATLNELTKEAEDMRIMSDHFRGTSPTVLDLYHYWERN